MEKLFFEILNMSITASILVVVIIALRIVLKRVPKAIMCVLWAFVAIRLVCPIAIESNFSLMPEREVIPKQTVSVQEDKLISESNTNINNIVINNDKNSDKNTVIESNPIVEDKHTDSKVDATDEVKETPTVSKSEIVISIASKVWIVGIIAMVIYAGVSYIRLYIRIREAVQYKDNIWLCDNVSSPFILGLIRPRIILPSNINDNEMVHILAHEQSHIKRLDHLWKPLGFILLAIYWFNPFIWVAYILLCKDIEMACDEKVVKGMDLDGRKEYSSVLFEYSVSRKMITACPLAFGETSVTSRIKSVLSYKKPTFWVVLVAVIVCAGVAVAFLTNPKAEDAETDGTKGSVDEESNQYYQYPNVSGMEYVEKVEACRIDQEILDKMTTDELAQAVADFPLLDMYVLSSYTSGGDLLLVICDAYGELLTRKDAEEVLVEKVKILKEKFGNQVLAVTVLEDIIYQEFRKGVDSGEILNELFETENITFENVDNYSYFDYKDDQHGTYKLVAKMDFAEEDYNAIKEIIKKEPGRLLEMEWNAIKDEVQMEDFDRELFGELTDFVVYEDCSSMTVSKVDTEEVISEGEYYKIVMMNDDTNEIYVYYYNTAIEKLNEDVDDLQTYADFSYEMAVVGYSSADKFVDDALNYDAIHWFSSLQFPIQRVDSTEELENFKYKYKDEFELERNYYDSAPDFATVVKKYDDLYFEKNTLFMIYVSTDEMNNDRYVKEVYNDGKTFRVTIGSELDIGTGDSALSGYLLMVEVTKQSVEECENFYASYH